MSRPDGVARGQASAMRRPAARVREAYGWGSPSLSRAHRSRRGPAEIDLVRPSPETQSSDRVRGDLPPSTVEMIAGQASRVDANRASTLLDGMRRSRYSTAPSMQISVFSPGLLANRLGRATLQSISISGMKNSSSGSSFVRMLFALRGAPCGDDSPAGGRNGHYHDEQSPGRRPSSDSQPVFRSRVFDVRLFDSKRVHDGFIGFFEGHSVAPKVPFGLGRVPVKLRHRGTLATAAYPGLIR